MKNSLEFGRITVEQKRKQIIFKEIIERISVKFDETFT
jgi:hypothetical protein